MLLRIKTLILVLHMVNAFTSALAQVEMNKKIIFIAPNDSLRQFKGIAYPDDTSSLLNFSASTTEDVISLFASGSGSYTANIPFAGFSLTRGTQIHLILQNTNTVNPTLNLFGTAIPIRYSDSTIIRSGVLVGGTSIRIIFDGTIFRMTQSFPEPCPPGFISVNDNYCIEKNERTATIYSTALTNCSNIGAQLCSWGEWFYACSNWPALGIVAMQGNWEFIDDSSDHTTTVGLIGVGGCSSFYTENLDAYNRNYRCCFRKY